MSDGLNNEKLYYDGVNLAAKANLGNLQYSPEIGNHEIYKAESISFHYPSEHMITMAGQAPRYPLEIQIHHKLIKSSSSTQVTRATVSLLFDQFSPLPNGDPFIYNMGIGPRQLRINQQPWAVGKGEFIDLNQEEANMTIGLNAESLGYLKMLMQQDEHIFMYEGSETKPPCKEDMRWFVFANARSCSKAQISYLQFQLMKVDDTGKKYGNNRGQQFYDTALNGMVKSMKQGVGEL